MTLFNDALDDDYLAPGADPAAEYREAMGRREVERKQAEAEYAKQHEVERAERNKVRAEERRSERRMRGSR